MALSNGIPQPRVAILLYTTECLNNLNQQHRNYLQELGFVVPEYDKGGDSGEVVGSFKISKGQDSDGGGRGVQSVGSGEGSSGWSANLSFRDQVEVAASEGAQPVGSGEGHVGARCGVWCGLCEEWVFPEVGLECKSCGCRAQWSPKEASSKITKN